MTDAPSALADLRCPRCDAVQPLYVGASATRGLQRGPEDVVPCPGCGLQLRLEADPRDPGGVLAGAVMIVGLTGAIVALVWLAVTWELGEVALGFMVVALLVLAVGAGIFWNARAAARHRVLVIAQSNGHGSQTDKHVASRDIGRNET